VYTGHGVRPKRGGGLRLLGEELRLRRQLLCLEKRLLRSNGVHLEFGVRLAAGLVVEVIVRGGAGPAHRRTALVAPRHLRHDVVLRGDGGRLSTRLGLLKRRF
jgi:hypothetical protein